MTRHDNPARMRFEIGSFSDAVEALQRVGGNLGKLGHNTEILSLKGGGVGIKLHGTIIVEYFQDRIVLDSGGYLTVTTKARMNEVLPSWVRVSQVRGDWSVTIKQGLYDKGRTIPFADGMTILTDEHGLARNPSQRNPGINPGMGNHAERDLEDAIDRYSLSDVLGTLANICSAKADHLRSNWQDENAAKEWDRAATLCSGASDKVNV